MRELPTGTVTFLFTDIEGSTRMLQALGARWRTILEDHNRLLRVAIRDAGGIDVRTVGDSFFAVFRTALAALSAAGGAQRALAAYPWPPEAPVRVRMGIHTGDGTVGGDDYVGIDVHRAARIAAVAYGGQVLLSSTSSERLGGASHAIKERAGGHAPPPLIDLPDPREAARAPLGEAAVEAVWQEGRAMTLEQALAYARQERT